MLRSFGAIGAALIGCLTIAAQSWASVGPGPVPEIDATGALTGLAMLAAVLALVAERKRQK
jgi:hypothetical protein